MLRQKLNHQAITTKANNANALRAHDQHLRTVYGVTVSTNNTSKWITAFALVIIALEINKKVDHIGADVFFWIAVVVGAMIVIID